MGKFPLVLLSLFLTNSALSSEVLTLPYAVRSGTPLQLDVHYPSEPEVKEFPVILWFHGGGWRNGSRKNCKLVQWLTSEGFAIVSVDYRLSQDAPFPAQQEDCQDAVRWILENGSQYRLDADHIVTAGLSAGAHLASLTALSFPKDTGSLRGVLHFYGPSDFTRMMRYAKKESDPLNQKDSNVYQLFDGPLKDRAELGKQASPVSHLDASDPPLLILVGTEDSLMTQRQCHHLHEKATEIGVSSKLIVIDGAGHGGPEFSDAERKSIIRKFLLSLSPSRSNGVE